MTVRSAEVCEYDADRIEQIWDGRDSVPLRPQAVILRWQRLPGRPWWGQKVPSWCWRKGINRQPWGPLSSQRVQPPPGKGLLLSLCRDEQVLPKKHLETCQPCQVALTLESKQMLVESSSTCPRPMPPWLALSFTPPVDRGPLTFVWWLLDFFLPVWYPWLVLAGPPSPP